MKRFFSLFVLFALLTSFSFAYAAEIVDFNPFPVPELYENSDEQLLFYNELPSGLFYEDLDGNYFQSFAASSFQVYSPSAFFIGKSASGALSTIATISTFSNNGNIGGSYGFPIISTTQFTSVGTATNVYGASWSNVSSPYIDFRIMTTNSKTIKFSGSFNTSYVFSFAVNGSMSSPVSTFVYPSSVSLVGVRSSGTSFIMDNPTVSNGRVFFTTANKYKSYDVSQFDYIALRCYFNLGNSSSPKLTSSPLTSSLIYANTYVNFGSSSLNVVLSEVESSGGSDTSDIETGIGDVSSGIQDSNNLLQALVQQSSVINQNIATVIQGLNTINSTIKMFEAEFGTFAVNVEQHLDGLISHLSNIYIRLGEFMTQESKNDWILLNGLGFLQDVTNPFNALDDTGYHEEEVATLRATLLGMNNNFIKVFQPKEYLAYTNSGIQAVTAKFPDMIHNNFLTLDELLSRGFVGDVIFANGLASSSVVSSYVFDNDLNRTVVVGERTSLLQAINEGFSSLQNPLSQLQAVLANDDDLELRRQTQDQVDSVTDNFTGNGAGSVSSDTIGDMANVSSGFQDSFNSGVSIGDGFTTINDSDNYSFFSAETRAQLEGTAPSFQSDDFFDFGDYEFDDDGFVSQPGSGFDVSEYLFGVGD